MGLISVCAGPLFSLFSLLYFFLGMRVGLVFPGWTRSQPSWARASSQGSRAKSFTLAAGGGGILQ